MLRDLGKMATGKVLVTINDEGKRFLPLSGHR